MEIRKMTINDYDEVYKLWMSSKNMGFNDVDDSREGIEKYLRRNPDTSFVAFADGELAGVILGGHDGRRGLIHHLCVHPGFRRMKQGLSEGEQVVIGAVAGLGEHRLRELDHHRRLFRPVIVVPHLLELLHHGSRRGLVFLGGRRGQIRLQFLKELVPIGGEAGHLRKPLGHHRQHDDDKHQDSFHRMVS